MKLYEFFKAMDRVPGDAEIIIIVDGNELLISGIDYIRVKPDDPDEERYVRVQANREGVL